MNQCDIGAQLVNPLDNLKPFCGGKLSIYRASCASTTNASGVNPFFEAYDDLIGRLPESACRLAPKLLEATRRAYTWLLVKI